jgi:hypothetical protein
VDKAGWGSIVKEKRKVMLNNVRNSQYVPVNRRWMADKLEPFFRIEHGWRDVALTCHRFQLIASWNPHKTALTKDREKTIVGQTRELVV